MHVTRHCDLKTAAGLILQLGNRGSSLRTRFDSVYTRNGTLDSLQKCLVSFYGPNYNLESLQLPWIPREEDWQPVKPLLEERLSRIPETKASGRNCTLCKGERRQCPLCRLHSRQFLNRRFLDRQIYGRQLRDR